MPLSKKEEDTFREVLSSLLKVDDSEVTRVLEVLGPNLDSLTGTGADSVEELCKECNIDRKLIDFCHLILFNLQFLSHNLVHANGQVIH